MTLSPKGTKQLRKYEPDSPLVIHELLCFRYITLFFEKWKKVDRWGPRKRYMPIERDGVYALASKKVYLPRYLVQEYLQLYYHMKNPTHEPLASDIKSESLALSAVHTSTAALSVSDSPSDLRRSQRRADADISSLASANILRSFGMISLAEYWKHDPPSKKKIFTPAYLQCILCNKFCPNKRGCMIQAYKESYIREKLVNNKFHWWERGFIQAYAQLWFHAHHSANQATRFLIYACPIDPLRETTRLVLDDATKYIVHVALSNGISDGDHYAIMWFNIAQKKIEVLEGIRDFSGSSRKLRGYTFNRDAFAVLRLCSLVGEDIRNIRSSGWNIHQGPSIYHQTNGWNCGPIACATTQFLLVSDDGMRVFNNLRDLGAQVPPESNSLL